MVLREFLFFFALALTTYDALQKAPPKISDVPQASPFFNEGSLVTDWYRGELSKAFSIIATYDVSFVMYYAPWDAECQHAKKEFDKTAQVMFKEVHFAAINCWNPGGECRLHHTNIDIWPIIIVHTNLWKTLIYSGPKDFTSMVKFLHQVLKPMIHLNSYENLIDFVTTCDAVVVGFTPLINESSSYGTFYNVAMKNLEYDPFRDICFGIVTSEKLALEMGVTTLPFVKFILWNNTLEYPIESGFNEENISNWILINMYKHIYWITPPWQKSYKLRAFFNRGPVLLMFTPRNHFYERLPYYDLLREIAEEYNNCGDARIKTIIKLRKIQRQKYLDYEKMKKALCKNEETFSSKLKVTPPQRSINHNTVKNVWLNKTSCKKDNIDNQLFFFSLSEKSYTLSGLFESPEKTLGLDGYCLKNEEFCTSEDPMSLSKFLSNYDRFENKIKNIAVFENVIESDTSMYNTANDPRSSINLLKRHMKDICINLDLAQSIGAMNIPIKSNRVVKIDGLRCLSNHTLSFVVIDSLLNSHFAESLGINIENTKDRTAVAILDNKHESQFVLRKPIGEYTLREFIYNFTMNIIPRDLRSGFGNSNYTHYYGSDKLFRNSASSSNNASGAIKVIHQYCQRSGNDYECIRELNSSMFHSFVSQKNKALLLALCSSGSGSCGGLLTLSLLSVARSLKGLKQHFEVARIDASLHDLPWEYTVAKYPTLIFFPAGKKEDSKSYPENQPITVESVLAFVLSGLETPLRLHAQVLLCNQTLDDFKMKKCLENTRQLVVGYIGKMLKLWRQNHDSAVKNILLRRLQCLRTVAINLGALNTTKVPLTHPIYKLFNESIRMLTNIWRTTVNPLTRRQKESLSYEDL